MRRYFSIVCLSALAAVVVLLGPASVWAGQAGFSASIFGSQEIRRDNLKPFAKWLDALDRYGAEAERPPADCAGDRGCQHQRWLGLIRRLQGQAPRAQLVAVNGFINQTPYVVDQNNWGVADYWASPGEFLARNGDCEDFAIAKYLTLRRLGFDAEALRIVVVDDTNLGRPHAILVVFVDHRAWVLDNQIKQVIETRAITHYRPIYSINEAAWWLHRG